jgi:SAM-dependent methyltransferase
LDHKPDWNERYLKGDLPWETGRVDAGLPNSLEKHGVTPCKVLELGAGTGNNAIWLAKAGYDVTATDLSAAAVSQAREKADGAGVSVQFVCADILKGDLPAGPFDLIFDRGCFHSFGERSDRLLLAKKISGVISDHGLWLSMIGSADSQPREMGPPRLSAEEVARSVEASFEIVSLESTHFDSEQPEPPAAWCCMMRKRTGRAEVAT